MNRRKFLGDSAKQLALLNILGLSTVRLMGNNTGFPAASGKAADVPYDYPDKYLYDENMGRRKGRGQTVRGLLKAMGDATFDDVKYINSRQGEQYMKFAKNMVLFRNGMDSKILAFWKQYGKGTIKEIHDTDTDFSWTSYIPVSVFKTENKNRKYPVMFQIRDSKDDLTLESYGNAYTCAEEEVILFIVPWYPDGGVSMEEIRKNGRMPPSTAAMWDRMQKMLEKVPADMSRIYVTGFSSSGFMSLAFALEHPLPIAGLLLGSHLFPYLWDFPSEEKIADLAQHKMPIINIMGLCDYGHPYPLYHGQNEVTGNGTDHNRTPEEAILRPNMWYTINDCPHITLEEATATKDYPDSRMAEKRIGVPLPSSKAVMIDDTMHYFGDVASSDGVVRTRFVAIENDPHWPAASFAGIGWDFIKHFSRDPKTHKSIYDGGK